jgi:hypothetical protein
VLMNADFRKQDGLTPRLHLHAADRVVFHWPRYNVRMMKKRGQLRTFIPIDLYGEHDLDGVLTAHSRLIRMRSHSLVDDIASELGLKRTRQTIQADYSLAR